MVSVGQAQSCQSATQVASDLWDEYGKTARQVGCVGVTAGTAVASGGASLPQAVSQYKGCMSKTGKVAEMTDGMIKAWNSLANDKWATIGPRRLVLNKTHRGNIVGPGTRVFVTESPIPASVLDVTIEKEKFRAETDVTVCTHLPGESPKRVWHVDIGAGAGTIGNTWNKQIQDVEGRIVSVFFNGRSAAKQMKYTLRAEPQDRLRFEPSEVATGQCTDAPVLYQHADFDGKSLKLTGDSYDNLVNQDFNDVASSICVPEGMTVELYRHAGFNQRVATLEGPDADFSSGQQTFNDEVSSVRIVGGGSAAACRGAPVLYQHADLNGKSLALTDDSYDNLANQDFNDVASSIWVPEGTTVELYRHAGFNQRVATLEGPDVDFSSGQKTFNDEVSSVKVVD